MKVVIIGAGVAGLGIGWMLAKAGVEVTVLERAQVGNGATTASAGMIAAAAELGETHTPEAALASKDMRDVIKRALEGMSATQRAVVTLRFLEDLSEREVAQILGCSIGTVKSQTSKAMSKLRHLAPGLIATGPSNETADLKQKGATE